MNGASEVFQFAQMQERTSRPVEASANGRANDSAAILSYGSWGLRLKMVSATVFVFSSDISANLF